MTQITVTTKLLNEDSVFPNDAISKPIEIDTAIDGEHNNLIVDLFNSISHIIVDMQEKEFHYAIRNNANPKLEGKLTGWLLRKHKIYVDMSVSPDRIETCLKQDEKRISRIIALVYDEKTTTATIKLFD